MPIKAFKSSSYLSLLCQLFEKLKSTCDQFYLKSQVKLEKITSAIREVPRWQRVNGVGLRRPPVQPLQSRLKRPECRSKTLPLFSNLSCRIINEDFEGKKFRGGGRGGRNKTPIFFKLRLFLKIYDF